MVDGLIVGVVVILLIGLSEFDEQMRGDFVWVFDVYLRV